MPYKKDDELNIQEWQIRERLPNVSFPLVMEPRHAAEFGYEYYEEPATPEVQQ